MSDQLFSDAPEELPDGSIMLVREIKKAFSGDDYKYIPEGQKKQVDICGIDMDDYSYYAAIHRYNQKFGLPHDSGWANELPWVPEFLAHMDDVKIMIEAWMMKSGNKTTESVDPRTFTGRN